MPDNETTWDPDKHRSEQEMERTDQRYVEQEAYALLEEKFGISEQDARFLIEQVEQSACRTAKKFLEQASAKIKQKIEGNPAIKKLCVWLFHNKHDDLFNQVGSVKRIDYSRLVGIVDSTESKISFGDSREYTKVNPQKSKKIRFEGDDGATDYKTQGPSSPPNSLEPASIASQSPEDQARIPDLLQGMREKFEGYILAIDQINTIQDYQNKKRELLTFINLFVEPLTELVRKDWDSQQLTPELLAQVTDLAKQTRDQVLAMRSRIQDSGGTADAVEKQIHDDIQAPLNSLATNSQRLQERVAQKAQQGELDDRIKLG